MTEAEIQKAIVDYLNAVLPRQYRVYANPNAARRKANGRASNGVPGLRKGIPDLTIRGPGGVAYDLEVKSQKGSLTPEQDEWGSWIIGIGGKWACVRSIDETRAALAHWCIETREVEL